MIQALKLILVVLAAILISHHVTDAVVVAALKAFPVIVTKPFRNIRVAIFIAVIDVRCAVVFVILPSPHHAILKAAPLSVVELRWRVIPFAAMLPVARWRALLRGVLGAHCSRRTQQEEYCARCR
jgi:hypothetical protein